MPDPSSPGLGGDVRPEAERSCWRATPTSPLGISYPFLPR